MERERIKAKFLVSSLFQTVDYRVGFRTLGNERVRNVVMCNGDD